MEFSLICMEMKYCRIKQWIKNPPNFSPENRNSRNLACRIPVLKYGNTSRHNRYITINKFDRNERYGLRNNRFWCCWRYGHVTAHINTELPDCDVYKCMRTGLI